jgi:F-type H+-transporting ATPase subunit delta
MAAVAGRYARAFVEVVVEHKISPDKAVQELSEMAALFEESAELRNVLLNPGVEHTQKLALLDAIVKRIGATKLLRNFVAVLIDHKRILQIGEITAVVKQELERRLGIAEARVTSFRTLSESEKKSLETQLTAATGKTVRATYSDDPGLLGGAVVRIGSTIYDGSVRGRLQRMKEEIAGS